MKSPRSQFWALSLILALRPGCGPFKPEKAEKRDAHEVPKRCTDGSSMCYDGCFKRQEGQSCTSCCFEHLILCDEAKTYNFQKCDTIEREVRGP